jgi:thiopeptide-type bacteriocin biosynthesis protein
LTLQDDGAHDRSLTVDLDNALSVDSLAHVLAQGAATLVEMWPSPDRLCARGPRGAYVHELIVPLLSDAPASAPPPRPRAATTTTMIQSFAPGSEWLHVKLFANPAPAEHLLRELVAPLVEAVTACGAADRWFFIRYDDPQWHVRLRLHGPPARLHDEVLPRLEQAALARSPEPIWRIQIEPYDREIDRYGGPDGIVIAEEIFWRDSVAALSIVDALAAEPDDTMRRHALFRGADALLDDLGYDLAGKRELVARLAADWNRGLDVDETRRLGLRFRHERAALEAALRVTDDRVGEALHRRSAHLRPVAARLRALEAEGALTRPRAEIVASLLHMHLNRVAIRMSRAEEGAIYDLLARVYEGLMRRVRGS